jgi:Universal stress protein family
MTRLDVRRLRTIRADGYPVAASLSSAAEAWGADLLVMGSYNRGPLREEIFGGCTRSILDHAPVPAVNAISEDSTHNQKFIGQSAPAQCGPNRDCGTTKRFEFTIDSHEFCRKMRANAGVMNRTRTRCPWTGRYHYRRAAGRRPLRRPRRTCVSGTSDFPPAAQSHRHTPSWASLSAHVHLSAGTGVLLPLSATLAHWGID